MVVAVLRLGLTVQVASAGVIIVTTGAAPVVSAWLAFGACVFSLAYLIALVRAQRFLRSWVLADVVIGLLALVVTSRLDPPSTLVGDWLHWAPAYNVQIPVFVAGWSRSIRWTAVFGCVLGGVYLAATVPGRPDMLATVLIQALSYPVFGMAAAVFMSYTQRVAAEADANRLAAVRAATALELSNYRFHVHNATGLLARLGSADVRPEELPVLRRQAAAEANRLRHEFLIGKPAIVALPEDKPVRLSEVVWNATSGFGSLPLELALTLGQAATVTPRQALALRAALVSLLHNVQFHARASTVTIHADARDGRWELIVRDDGAGFDPDPERFGFGLREQVIHALQANGMSVRIDSSPGGGTCAEITGQDLSATLASS